MNVFVKVCSFEMFFVNNTVDIASNGKRQWKRINERNERMKKHTHTNDIDDEQSK